MKLDRHRMLETSLFDLEQIVTVQYLSRHADIPIDDAKNELVEFFIKNKDRTELHAVYVLSGELRALNCISNDSSASYKRFRTQLVRDCDLEITQQAYSEIHSCEIYCLHIKPIKNLCFLYSLDSVDDVEYVRTDSERCWLSYPEAEVKREEMLAQHSTVPMLEIQNENDLRKEDVAQTSRSLERTVQTMTNDIFSMSKKPATQKKRKSDDAKTSVYHSVQKDGEQTIISSGRPVKRRGQRISIDIKEDVVEESKFPTDANFAMAAKEKVAPNKDTTSNNWLLSSTQDDLFSDGGSSPERMDIAEKGKFEEKEALKDLRPTCVGLENRGAQEKQRKALRKEYVAETFIDNDGFMVTKQVLKEIEVEQSQTDTLCEKDTKTNASERLEIRPHKDRKAPGQTKISSFFQKK